MKRQIYILLLFILIVPSAVLAAQSLRVSNFDFEGNLEEETVTLHNKSNRLLNFRGWMLYNELHAIYRFPSLKLKRGESITVRSSEGANRLKGKRKLLYLNRTEKAWNPEGGILKIRNGKSRTVLTCNYGESTNPLAKKVFFIHHSTGQIYWEGGLKAALEAHGYSGRAPWWDGGTDPYDFPSLFNSSDSWQIIGDANIILFKSCFPASNITSDEMLEEYKGYYRQLYSVYAKYPNRVFVPMSTPPLLRNNTSYAAAKRALEFEEWLLNEYKTAYTGTNLAPFGLHSLLSDSDGYLDSEFAGDDPADDHPNSHSGTVVGEALWKHLEANLGSL